MSHTAGAAYVPLSQGFGYGIILGLGFAFALGMIGTTWALKRYHGEVCHHSYRHLSLIPDFHYRYKHQKLSQQRVEVSSLASWQQLSSPAGPGLRRSFNPQASHTPMVCLARFGMPQARLYRFYCLPH